MRTRVSICSTMNEKIEQICEALQRLSPPIEAYGIGGSIGAGDDDAYSDLDFFLLIQTEKFFSTLSFLQESLVPDDVVAALEEPVGQAGFGFQFGYILEDGSGTEFFVNCRETLTWNPMRTKTHILFDSTGFFTEFVEKGEQSREELAATFFSNLSYQYLTEIAKTRKYIMRNEAIPLQERVLKLMRIVASLRRYERNGELCAPHDALRGLADSLGGGTVDELRQTLDELAMVRAVDVLRDQIVERLKRLPQRYRPRAEYFQAEGEAFSATRRK